MSSSSQPEIPKSSIPRTGRVTHLVDPTNPNDETSEVPGEPRYSAANPHPLLGMMDPPQSWYDKTRMPSLRDDQGNIVLDQSGKEIRDFPGWPRYISSTVRGDVLERLFRTSCLVDYSDIWARQPSWMPPLTKSARNIMNNHRERQGRRPYGARCWCSFYKKRVSPKVLIERVEKYTPEQIAQNTTFRVTAEGIRYKPQTQLFQLGYYLTDGSPHKPSTEIQEAMKLSRRLTQIAAEHEKDHWSGLPQDLLPKEWYSRAKGVNENRKRTLTTDPSQSNKRVRTTEEGSYLNKSEDNDSAGIAYSPELVNAGEGRGGNQTDSEELPTNPQIIPGQPTGAVIYYVGRNNRGGGIEDTESNKGMRTTKDGSYSDKSEVNEGAGIARSPELVDAGEERGGIQTDSEELPTTTQIILGQSRGAVIYHVGRNNTGGEIEATDSSEEETRNGNKSKDNCREVEEARNSTGTNHTERTLTEKETENKSVFPNEAATTDPGLDIGCMTSSISTHNETHDNDVQETPIAYDGEVLSVSDGYGRSAGQLGNKEQDGDRTRRPTTDEALTNSIESILEWDEYINTDDPNLFCFDL